MAGAQHRADLLFAAWPVAGATFILMPKKPTDLAAAKVALTFFDWAYAKGDKMAADLDYVPMPDAVVALVKKEWTKITDPAGKPVM